jgi:hypothetical protein
MLDGSATVVTNSLLCVLACIGMCSGRPRVVPISMAGEAGPAAVSELQFTANVVAVPAVAGLGVISTGAELPAAAVAANSISPAGNIRTAQRVCRGWGRYDQVHWGPIAAAEAFTAQ